MKWLIRDLEIKDISVCEQIVEKHWGKAVAENAAMEMMEMFSKAKWPPHYFVACDQDNIVVGFAGFKSSWLMSNTYELIWINVAPGILGQGVGKALTHYRLREIKNRGGALVMLMTQKPKFFEQFDFKEVAIYDDWVLMVNQLAPVTIGWTS